MWRNIVRVGGICAVVVVSLAASPTTKAPLETRNAALRYWLAFAELQDPPSDKPTAGLLEKVAGGEAAWDEARLGPILDKNVEALGLFVRATKLPECDWGLEYSRGATASIAYVPRARVLARLNTLAGMRLASQGREDAAVDTWLAGIRFSGHLAQGGPLLSTLIAKTALLSSMNALSSEAEHRKLPMDKKAEVERVIRSLPENGFDWGKALSYEEYSITQAIREMRAAPRPSEYYETIMGKPMSGNSGLPNAADDDNFAAFMNEFESALTLKPESTSRRIETLQMKLQSLHLIYRELIPSIVKINESRMQVVACRKRLLEALTRR